MKDLNNSLIEDGSRVSTTTGPTPENHPQVIPSKVGVLLANLGTPDSTDYWAIRRYLSEFLSDRRVIEVNPIIFSIKG